MKANFNIKKKKNFYFFYNIIKKKNYNYLLLEPSDYLSIDISKNMEKIVSFSEIYSAKSKSSFYVIIVWRCYSGEIERIFNLKETVQRVYFSQSDEDIIFFQNNGMNIYKISPLEYKREIHLHKIKNEKKKIRTLISFEKLKSIKIEGKPHLHDGLHDIDVSPDNEHLAVIKKDKSCYIINLFQNFQKHLKSPYPIALNVVSYNHDGSLLAAGDFSGKIILWDCKLRSFLKEITGHLKCVLCLKFNLNSEYLVSGDENNTVIVFDVRMGSSILTITAHTNIIRTVGFNLEGDIISASNDKTVRITPLNEGDKKREKVLNIDREFISIAVNADGTRLVASFENQKLMLWDLKSLELLKVSIDYDHIIEKLYFHSDSKIILTTRSGSAKIFNIESQIIEKVIKGYAITDMVTTADDKWLIIGTNIITLKFAGLNYNEFIELMNFIKVIDNYVKKYSLYDDETVLNLTSFFQNLNNYLKETVKKIANLKFPFEMTILHFLCYLDDARSAEFLINLLIINGLFIPPSKDSNNNSPLDIVIKNNNSTILNSLINYYSQEEISKLSFQSCSESYTDCLEELLTNRVTGLPDLLNSRVFKARGKIPEFFQKPKQRIKIFSFDSPMPKEEDYLDMLFNKKSPKGLNKFSSIANKIKIKAINQKDILDLKNKLLNKVDLKKRSRVNFKIVDLKGILDPKLKFLDQLIEYPSNHPIFSAEVVYYVIQYKWQTFGRRLFIQKAIIFLIFVALTTVNSTFLLPERLIHNKRQVQIFLIDSFTLEGIILLYILYFFGIEILKMKKSGFFNYWRSTWNFIDFAIVLLTFSSCISDFILRNPFKHQEIYRGVHAITIFLVYFRLLSYIRCFDNLSFMIRMIIQCAFDMRFYLFIIGFVLIPLTLSSLFFFFIINLNPFLN